MKSSAPKLCSVPGCNRGFVARGYCRTHYQRLKKHGDASEHIPVKWRTDSVENFNCRIAGCSCNTSRTHSGFGLCHIHYQRFRRTDRTDLKTNHYKWNGCNVLGCPSDKPGGRGLCTTHYMIFSHYFKKRFPTLRNVRSKPCTPQTFYKMGRYECKSKVESYINYEKWLLLSDHPPAQSSAP